MISLFSIQRLKTLIDVLSKALRKNREKIRIPIWTFIEKIFHYSFKLIKFLFNQQETTQKIFICEKITKIFFFKYLKYLKYLKKEMKTKLIIDDSFWSKNFLSDYLD